MTNDSSPKDYAMLAYAIASQYVESPSNLKDVEAERRGSTLIVRFPGKHLKVDHGRLIGGGGKNFRALKRILQESAKGSQLRVDLEITDPGGEYVVGEEVHPDPHWNKDEAFREVLEMIVEKVFDWSVPVLAESRDGRTYLTIESEIDPEVLSSFQILWKAIGRHHGRNFILNAEAPRAVANG